MKIVFIFSSVLISIIIIVGLGLYLLAPHPPKPPELVADYLPFFEVDYPTPDSPPITICHLLNHTSGLPDTIPAMIAWVHTADEGVDQTALLQRELPNYRKLHFAPGSDSAYSNPWL